LKDIKKLNSHLKKAALIFLDTITKAAKIIGKSLEKIPFIVGGIGFKQYRF
jgi:hypothetical protein